MVWDMFSAHLKDSIKSAVVGKNSEMCIIPGGLTSLLQPLDVCLNKPFKDRVRQMWSDWICSDAVKTTKSGLPQRPDLTLVCRWVKDAWDAMPREMIQKSFLKCGISNALDGTEDDAIYEDEETDEEQEEDSDEPYTDAAEATPEELRELFASDDSDTELEGF